MNTTAPEPSAGTYGPDAECELLIALPGSHPYPPVVGEWSHIASWLYPARTADEFARHLVDAGIGYWPADPRFAARPPPPARVPRRRPTPEDADSAELRAFLRETGSEQPGISVYKLCTAPPVGHWHVTATECATALTLWDCTGRPALPRSDEQYLWVWGADIAGWPTPPRNGRIHCVAADFANFLTVAAQHGGFDTRRPPVALTAGRNGT